MKMAVVKTAAKAAAPAAKHVAQEAAGSLAAVGIRNLIDRWTDYLAEKIARKIIEIEDKEGIKCLTMQ